MNGWMNKGIERLGHAFLHHSFINSAFWAVVVPCPHTACVLVFLSTVVVGVV